VSEGEPWAATIVLGDGETVAIRPMTPADADGLVEFHGRQSPDSVYRRYFSPKPRLTPAELKHFTDFDFTNRASVVVESHGEFLGWASYARWPGRDDADTAFMVDDRQQGRGIATLMLERLAAIAKSNGIERFTAEVLAENRPMLSVFARAGWPVERKFHSGVIEVDFPLEDTAEYIDSMSKREQRADSRAMARLLLPRSIAVVGASDNEDTIGGVLWRNVVAHATGPVYAVNPAHATIGGARAYARLTDIGEDVSLATVAVPANQLEAAIDDCIEARVRGAVVHTNVDGSGIDVEALVGRARNGGVRIIGPSSMGVATSRADVGLHATFVPGALRDGGVALSLQSGSLGTSIMRLADQLGVGLSWFVSLGDRSDVSGNDLLQFWDDDDSTTAIGMYTESIGNPRRFARIARRVSRRRPIVAVHTGAAAIGPSGGALYQHSGLIEVPTVVAMLDTVRVLASQPVMRGPRTAVISNAKSPLTLARAAIEVADLTPVRPPITLDFRSTPDDFGAALRAALASDEIDGVMVIHAPPLESAIGEPIAAIDAAAQGATKPVVAVLLGARDGPIAPGSTVPGFAFPEVAAAVLGRSYAYGRWQRTEAAAVPAAVTDVDDAAVDSTIAAALGDGRLLLDITEIQAVLGSYRIVMPTARLVPAGDALAAAREIGYPVAIKARHRHIGRSLKAGVALDLTDTSDVVESVRVMREELGADADEVLVQAMTTPGVDLRIHVTLDERLGSLVSVGLGGVGGDLLADEDVRLAPLSIESARALVSGSRAGAALEQAGIAPDLVVDTLIRTAHLAAEHPAFVEIDLNPVITTTDACCVTDAVVTVAPTGRPEAALRQL
jgi:acyl-CoA synthetase (NDP forming)/GNAT superfamily N-acetyltransferase